MISFQTLEVRRRVRRPSGLERLPKPRCDFVVSQKLAAIELIETLRHLPPEPRIMIHVALDKPLDVLVRIAAILRATRSIFS